MNPQLAAETLLAALGVRGVRVGGHINSDHPTLNPKP